MHDWDLDEFTSALGSKFDIELLLAQLPIDDVFDADFPPGMWRIDLTAPSHNTPDEHSRRPDFFVAVARPRGALRTKVPEPLA